MSLLERLEELEKRATPGPFPIVEPYGEIPNGQHWNDDDEDTRGYLGVWGFSECGCEVTLDDDTHENINWRLLAEARNALPTLLAEIRRLRAALEHYARLSPLLNETARTTLAEHERAMEQA